MSNFNSGNAIQQKLMSTTTGGSTATHGYNAYNSKLKFFKIEDFIHSDTAIANKIDNTPGREELQNIFTLIKGLADPLAALWYNYCQTHSLPKPWTLNINSGYRCPKLNAAVGGASDSSHKYGLAVDLRPSNWHMAEFKICVTNYLKNRSFDQLIYEKPPRSGGVPTWIHVGLYNSAGQQRRSIFEIL